MKRKWLSAGGSLWLAFIALNALALRISPVAFDLTLPRGAERSFAFQLENNEGEVLQLEIGLCDWIRDLDGRNLFCEEAGEVPRSATSWVSVAPTQFELAPGEKQEVRFTVSVPSEGPEGAALDGTYWTSVMVEATPKPPEGQPPGTEIIVKRRFGLKVLLSIAGTGTKSGQVGNLERHGLNPLWMTFEFQNRGTLNLKDVSGRVEIRDTRGATLEKIPVQPFSVLPGYTRRLVVQSARPRGEGLPPGDYVILAILDYGGDTLVGAQLILRIAPLKLRPLGDGTSVPLDLDGDGFYEDVNGDGQLTLDDPTLLAEHLEEPVVQENWRAFDYNNDGLVDFDDVLTLKEWAQAEAGSMS